MESKKKSFRGAMSPGYALLRAPRCYVLRRLFAGCFLCFGPQLFEDRILPEMFRKPLLIKLQRRTDQVMFPSKPKLFHFFERLICGPSLIRHAINRDRHPRAIVAQTAMDKHLLFGMLVNHLQKPREDRI